MSGTNHKDILVGQMHAVANWVYADAAARTAATGFIAADVGKLAWQQSDDTLWMLKATTPTWVQHSFRVGTAAGTVAAGNDSRLSDARTPTAHATSHKTGGSDVIRLDELAVPTADVSLNTHKITNLAAPTGANDAARKADVDAAVAGLDWKASVRAATTANGTLATAFSNGQVIDGVTLVTGDRVLLKNQTTGSENGLYTVNASGTPTRAADADAAGEVTGGLTVFVEEGTTQHDTQWVLTNDGVITLGTTALVFSQFGVGLTAHHATHEVGGSDPLSGVVPGSAFAPAGLTGATAATRYVGGTASGAPASGAFNKGDHIVTQDGAIYICTTAGSPGTWAAVSGGGGGAALTIEEVDGSPTDSAPTKLVFPNGTLGLVGHVMTYTPAGGGGGGGVGDKLYLANNFS
jgi:hypothetical protein